MNTVAHSTVERDLSQPEFVALLAGAHSRLLGYLMSLLGNQSDAEDVLQQASVTMWEKFDLFVPGTDFLKWASRIAFYEARNFQRIASRSRLHFDDDLIETLSAERLEDLSSQSGRLAALRLCLQGLSEDNRQLVNSAYFDQSSIMALAAGLKRAPQTLYNKLNTIRRLLAECVQRQYKEGDA